MVETEITLILASILEPNRDEKERGFLGDDEMDRLFFVNIDGIYVNNNLPVHFIITTKSAFFFITIWFPNTS